MEYSVITVLTALALGFIAGTSLTWTSPERTHLNETVFDDNLQDNDWSWIGGLLSLGAAVGPFIFSYLADKIGRKYTLLAVSVPFAVSSVICAFANTIPEFMVARLITGFGVGGTFTILPMYVGEMSLDEHRGALGSGMNAFICAGLIFTYVVGYFVSNVMVFNLLLAGITAMFFLLFFLIGTETPHYHVQKNQHDLAKEALLKIRNAPSDETEKELEMIRKEIEKEERGSLLDIFRTKGNIKAFIIGAGLVFFQQASGINAVLFFAQTIFEDAGTTLEAGYCSMIIGAVQFGTSFITPLVSNLFGRKFLLIFSSIGMCLSESILGVYDIIKSNHPDSVSSSLSFLPILSLVLYIITYNVGIGPLPWAIIAEIFPTNIKAPAGALAASVCWFTSFLITNWFTQIVHKLGQGQCFLGFAGFSLLMGVFTVFYVLETKGKSLAQIQADLNR
ncbi:facilitated trehalose transporter Tret1-like isoform X2 [Anthonomus grandis grandis]|uniref:facilitated trehalose transporter Tret1-like isoform X2 n=1 Tax=Anthonomus grandis grandis TaxID=2921223 RepID=UPI0021650458|nr:facilitated trehalose transporter Tret1-like isoform X2 [Anthonomus grandis grandis]